MRWIDSTMVWSHTVLLGICISDTSDPLIVGYLLELLEEGTLAGPTMLMRRASTTGFL
jgi:hypothetical protein